jgi:hypothetical protein
VTGRNLGEDALQQGMEQVETDVVFTVRAKGLKKGGEVGSWFM